MPLDNISLLEIIAIVISVALGGFIKGATGAGAPLLAVPLIASLADVRLAVIVMILPNLTANLWQMRHYYPSRPKGRMPWVFAGMGAVGSVIGTAMLVRLDDRWLMMGVALAVLAYIVLRTLVPSFRLSAAMGERLAAPAGLFGGILQGAAGISAPMSISFLNALRMERKAFIATIAVFFVGVSSVQLIAMTLGGIIDLAALALSVAACFPLFLAMPLGAWTARHMSASQFDRLLLFMLFLLSVRLLWDAFL